MKHNVKFSPERRKNRQGDMVTKKVPVFADIRFSGKRMFYFTGYRVDVDKFDSSKQQIRKNCIAYEGKRIVQYNEVNNRIKAIKAELELFFQKRDTVNEQELKDLLDVACKKEVVSDNPEDFFSLFEKHTKEAKVPEGRRRHMKSVINHWKRFQQEKRTDIDFQNVTDKLLKDFEAFLRKGGGQTKPKGSTTVRTIMSTTRTFWNAARKQLVKQGIELPYPFGLGGYRLPNELNSKPIYVTKEERDKLLKTKLNNDRLRRVRDIFVFQCLVGARVGDLCKLTKSNIVDSNGNYFLSYIPRKTKEGRPVEARVPLHPKAIEILSRYDLPDGRLLPFISDQRYNTYLKEVFKEAKLTRMVARLNPTTGEPEQVRLCDIASSHMARRAFVGNLYGKVDSGIICSMSGHKQGSKAFTRYYDVDEELQRKAIDIL